MKLKILTSIFIIILSSNLEAKNYDIERSKYTKALKYFKNKNYQKFIDLKEQLKEYPLYANLEYKNLHKFHLIARFLICDLQLNEVVLLQYYHNQFYFD